MRSRYSAYTLANIDYIAATMAGAAAQGFDPIEAKRWAQSVVWERLEVLHSSQHEDEGEVFFKAYFSEGGKSRVLAEHSLFKRINGRWMYIDRM